MGGEVRGLPFVRLLLLLASLLIQTYGGKLIRLLHSKEETEKKTDRQTQAERATERQRQRESERERNIQLSLLLGSAPRTSTDF